MSALQKGLLMLALAYFMEQSGIIGSGEAKISERQAELEAHPEACKKQVQKVRAALARNDIVTYTAEKKALPYAVRVGE